MDYRKIKTSHNKFNDLDIHVVQNQDYEWGVLNPSLMSHNFFQPFLGH